MPIVRTYTPQVNPQAAPTPERREYPIPQIQAPLQTNAPTAESYGAGFGNAVENLGQHLYAAEVQKQDDIRLTAAQRDLSDWELNTLYGDNGALKTQGVNALSLPDTVSQSFDATAGKIRQGLANDRQRIRFDELANNRRAKVLEQVKEHAATQSLDIDKEATSGLISNETSLAIQNAYSAPDVKNHLDTLRIEGTLFSDRMGWPQAKKNAFVDGLISNAHLGIINRMLDEGEDNHARPYFDAAKGEIEGDKIGPIKVKLAKGTALGEGQRLADAVWQSLPPDATQGQALDEVGKRASEAAYGNAAAEVRKVAEEQLTKRFTVAREDTRFQQEQASKQAKAMMDGLELQIKNTMDRSAHGMTYEQIVPQSIRDLLPESVEKAQREYWKQLSEGKKVETDFPTYNRLRLQAANDPNAFIKENLLGYMNKLDESDREQLTNLQADIIKGNREAAAKVLDGIRTPERIINSGLTAIGIDFSEKANRPAVDALWKAVDDRIKVLQNNTGKKAEDADIQSIVDDEITNTGQKGSWWGLLPGGGPLFDQKKYKFQTPQPVPGEISIINPTTKERLVLRNGQWVKP